MNLEQHKESFRQEAYELLEELEELLLELEQSPGNTELVGAVFRDLHTIKGSGSMFGFDAIASFTHEIENLFDQVRKGKMSVSKEMVDLSLKANDHIKYLLEHENMGEDGLVKGRELLEIAESLRSGEAGAVDEPVETGEEEIIETEPAEIGPDVTYRIRFIPPADAQENGTDVLQLLMELKDIGKYSISALVDRVPTLEELEPGYIYIDWDIIITTNRGINNIKDVFIFIEDDAEIDIAVIDEGEFIEEDGEYRKIGQLLVERGDISPESLQDVVNSRKRLGEELVERELVESDKVEAALAEQQHVRNLREQRKQVEYQSTIRVSAVKLDSLVNLVGELVIMQSNLNQLAGQIKNRTLSRVSKIANRLIWELRDRSMEMRMSPIGTCFSKFRRLVRDLSSELGKEVEMVTEGGDTELDKTIIERLNDPMVHLIRNCIDHGIETPEQRDRAGKERQGTIKLSASHAGAFISIVIKDDGAGIDVDAVKKKAIERGLMKKDEVLSEREIFSFLFEPGFSTAQSVSNVSGRGVGMDVIKKNIEALRGTIHLESRPGVGTTVMLKIPLTLVIIDGLLIKIGEEHFIIQLSQVEKVVELNRVACSDGTGNIANIHGEIVPFIRLRDQFDIGGEIPENPQIVIVESDEKRVGIAVDKVIGEYQTVIKSLGSVYKHIEGLSGATILGDGTIALILDVERLVQAADLKDNHFHTIG